MYKYYILKRCKLLKLTLYKVTLFNLHIVDAKFNRINKISNEYSVSCIWIKLGLIYIKIR